MCYEQYIEELHYSENAAYDRWDGHREDFGQGDCDGWPDWQTYLEYQEFCEQQDREDWEGTFDDADCEDRAAYLAGVGVADPPVGWDSV
jgi:hypothetical protein